MPSLHLLITTLQLQRMSWVFNACQIDNKLEKVFIGASLSAVTSLPAMTHTYKHYIHQLLDASSLIFLFPA